MKRNSRPRSAVPTIVFLAVLASACASNPPLSHTPSPSTTSQSATASPESASPSTSATGSVQFDDQLAMEAIREFTETPDLTLDLVELTTLINSPNADLVVAVFEDATGTRYSVDPQAYRVVELTPIIYALPAGPRLTADELRLRAEAMAEQYLLGFDEIKDRLVYEEGTKGDSFFFRWEDPTIPWTYNPAVFQAGLRVDGKPVAYLNTIPPP